GAGGGRRRLRVGFSFGRGGGHPGHAGEKGKTECAMGGVHASPLFGPLGVDGRILCGGRSVAQHRPGERAGRAGERAPPGVSREFRRGVRLTCQEAPMNHDLVDLGVGLLFVLFQAGRRFNTPSTNRSSTTAGRYYMALGVYWAAAGTTYLGLSEFPHLIRFLTADFVGAGQAPAVLAAAERLSSPLFAALLMTVLLPNLPLLSGIDRWIFRELQGVAAIPYEVRRLSAELRGLPCSLPADVREEIGERLDSEGIAGGDVRFEGGAAPQQAWTSLTGLFILVERWEKDRRMAAYVEEYA